MDDFGIDDELPSNPLMFILEAGTHHKYPELFSIASKAICKLRKGEALHKWHDNVM